MKNLSGQESLWVALPILVVIVILIAGLIFLPKVQTEIRSRASEPTPSVITPAPRTEPPEIVCSDLYTPVCGSNGITYPSECEANLAGITVFTTGRCVNTTPASPRTNTGSPNLLYTVPTSN